MMKNNWKRVLRSFFPSRGGNTCDKGERYSPDGMLDYLMSSQGSAVQVNTPEAALNLDTVYRCVDILSGTIASLPMEALVRSGSIFVPNETSPLNYLFAREANPRQTFFVLMQNAIISLYLRGNAYILPVYNEQGQPTQLYLLDAGSVVYDIQSNTYTVSDTKNQIFERYEAWQIIHLKNKTLDGGFMGVSTIQYAARLLNISANADQQTLEGFKRGNKFRGLVSGGNPVVGLGQLQDKVVEDVAQRLEQDVDNGRSIIRVPGSVTFTPMDMTPADVQLLENRKFSPYTICRFFGVHPDMVFVEQSSNYKASENSQITFLNQTLRPLIAHIEAEMMSKLIFGSRKSKLRQQIRFNLMPLFSTDLKSRAEYAKVSIECGAMTPNEWRILENRPPVEGGDQTFITCNVAPITYNRFVKPEQQPSPKPEREAEKPEAEPEP